jgi:hypothetical protein
MRLALLVPLFALFVAGCGDTTASTTAAADLSMELIDLSTPGGLACGVSACDTTGGCAACASVLGGVCAPPCKVGGSGCTAPATCRPATPDGDGGASATFGGDCAGYDGYCL